MSDERIEDEAAENPVDPNQLPLGFPGGLPPASHGEEAAEEPVPAGEDDDVDSEYLAEVYEDADSQEVEDEVFPDAEAEDAEPEEVDEIADAGEEAEPEEAAAPVGEAEEVAPARPGPRGIYLTPRQTFVVLASVLGVLLVGLVLYLAWLLRPADFTKKGGSTQGGLIPVVAVYGPGRGEFPAFNQPMGVAWSQDGTRMYVADARNNRICVFDDKGKPVMEFGGLGVAKPLEGAARTWDPGELSYPVDVAVDEEGQVYVADFYNDSVSVFDDKGGFVRRFPDPYKPTGRGSSGSDGGGIAVTSVAVRGDRVYATDTYQVFVFDKNGGLIEQFGKPGMGPDGLDHPGGIAVDRDGKIYVSDSNHNRVIAYTPEGRPLWVTGRPVSGLKSQTENPFVLPRGLTITSDGSIIVADPLAQQLVKLDEDGKVVAQYGVRGTSEGQLNFPMDVASNSDLLLVADRQNERAQVVKLSTR